MKTIVAMIVAVSAVFASADFASAQYYYGNNQGGNWGVNNNVNWQYQNQFGYQAPGARLTGGILQAVAVGLNKGNPQKNATAVGVLGSLGNTFNSLSGPTYREQGQINRSQQGGFNTFNNSFGTPYMNSTGPYQNNFQPLPVRRPYHFGY